MKTYGIVFNWFNFHKILEEIGINLDISVDRYTEQEKLDDIATHIEKIIKDITITNTHMNNIKINLVKMIISNVCGNIYVICSSDKQTLENMVEVLKKYANVDESIGDVDTITKRLRNMLL